MKVQQNANKFSGINLIFWGVALFILGNIFCYEVFLKNSNGVDPLPYLIASLFLTGIPIIMVENGVRSIKSLVRIEEKIDKFEKKISINGDKIFVLIIFLAIILAGYVIWSGISKYSQKDIWWTIGMFFGLFWGYFLWAGFRIILILMRNKMSK